MSCEKYVIILFKLKFLILFNYFKFIASEILLNEINCNLNELPITKLLKIKKSFDQLSCIPVNKVFEQDLNDFIEIDNTDNTNNKNHDNSNKTLITNAEALPLTSDTKQIEPRSYDYHDIIEEKPTKIQTIFQLSVTALTFLAFGGYLLCLIVQAIKSKGTTYYHPIATNGNTKSTNINPPLKKIKVYRRSRRMIEFDNKRKPRTNNRTNSFDLENFATPNPDDLYKILESLAEGYVKIVQFK